MNLTEYQTLAFRTEKPLPIEGRLQHAVLGICSELGELACLVQQVTYTPFSINLPADFKEELGDICWYLAIIFNVCEINAEACLRDGEFVISRQRRLSTWSPNYSIRDVKGLFAELCQHGGDIADVVKKRVIYNNRSESTYNELPCIAACMIANIYSMASRLGIEHSDILEHNIAKLRLRYPDKYSDSDALARADKEGDV